jgi:hypothetical protein
VADPSIYLNGIDPYTGKYLVEPLDLLDVYQMARDEEVPAERRNELEWWHYQVAQGSFGPKEGVDPRDLAESGWAILFGEDADPAVREALSPLIELRRAQVGDSKRFREFSGADGYRSGESKHSFLSRFRVGPGPADPDRVPYYLMIVGTPAEIPFEFQHEIDVQYAVGRLDLLTPEDYRRYADSVVRAESGSLSKAPRALFFGTRHDGDRATELSATRLLAPVAEDFGANAPAWEVETVRADGATRSRLIAELQNDAPSFLMTATHGIGVSLGDPRQEALNGALIGQDWAGPGSGPVADQQIVSGADIEPGFDLLGMVAFVFACFGGGTPRCDRAWTGSEGGPALLASRPFTARLPQRMLAAEGGGALAVVAHIDRAWSWSFDWPGAGGQTEVFHSTLRRLLKGWPVGSAIEYFNERYAELSTTLSRLFEDHKRGKQIDRYEIAAMWLANNDARGFTILGDPAVRLAVPTGPTAVPEVKPGRPVDVDPGTRSTDRPLHVVTADEPASPGSRMGEAVDFGLRDDLRQIQQTLRDTLADVAGRIGDAAGRLADGVSRIEVSTYVSAAIDDVEFDDKGQPTGAHRRVFTRTRIDGDTVALLPDDLEAGDKQLLDFHLGLVEQARETQAELLSRVTSAFGSIVGGLS